MGTFNNLEESNYQEVSAESVSATEPAVESARSVEDEVNASTLEAVNSCVMIADAQNIIIKLNPATMAMMKAAERDIQKELPNFSAANLIGTNIDDFHKNPAHQRGMLESLTSTYKGQITVGARTFDLTANPIFNDNKQRLGTVVEWEDVSDKLSKEKFERARAEKEKEAATTNSRIKSALDSVSSNVMVADENNIITYANPAVINMLRVAEGDIRKVLGNFNVDEMIGGSVDLFHKNPAHQKRMIASLQGTYETAIQVGVRNFSLIANPVFDSAGNRAGTVVEWKDRTLEIEFERRVESSISAAVDGNLVDRIDLDGSTDFIEAVGSGVNKLLEIFETTIANIGESSVQVKEASGEISSGNTNLSQRTEEQAASLEETSAAMEQITTTVQQNAANAVQANNLARGAREAAENGGEVVGNAVSAMQAISESSNKINDIIGVIDEIAFQTNLLALNAAVEAARAGDQGRGFAVVADEVRSLAGRSATAAKEIKGLIKDSGEKVQEGSDLVNKSGETLAEIVSAVKKVNDIVAEISTASDEQATGLDEINKAIGEMDEMTQQNAALVEEAAAASEELLGQAESLDFMVSKFDTSCSVDNSAPSAPQGVAVSERTKAKRPARAQRPQKGGDEEWSKF